MSVGIQPGEGIPSDKLVPPMNAPGGGQVSPGVQPGVSSQVVLAQYVVVFGATGGIFVYSGSPGLGNPPIYSTSNANFDPYGNPVYPGIWAGTYAGVQVGMQVLGDIAQILFKFPGGFNRDAFIGAFEFEAGAPLQIASAQDTASGQGSDYVFIDLLDAQASGDAAQFAITYTPQVGVSGGVIVTVDYRGLSVSAAQPIPSVQPGTGGSATSPAVIENWHPLTLSSGWAASSQGVKGCYYRMLPLGLLGVVEVIGDLTPPTGSTSSLIGTLPVGYRTTAAEMNLVAGTNNDAVTPHILVTSAGTMTAQWSAANTVGSFFFHLLIPLDVPT